MGGEAADEVVDVGSAVGEECLLVVEHSVGLLQASQLGQCHPVVGIQAGMYGVLVEVLVDGFSVCLSGFE